MRKTILRIVVIIFIVGPAGVVFTEPAEAKRYRYYCQGDHLHFGSSSGHRSRKAALRAAISDWAGFTAFEYGDHYANWRIAKNKRVGCNRDRFSRQWKCSLQATPCRRG